MTFGLVAKVETSGTLASLTRGATGMASPEPWAPTMATTLSWLIRRLAAFTASTESPLSS